MSDSPDELAAAGEEERRAPHADDEPRSGKAADQKRPHPNGKQDSKSNDRNSKGKSHIFVRAQGGAVQKDELLEYCQTNWGEVADVSTTEKGYAFITFGNIEDAFRFLEQENHTVGGRNINARAALPAARGGTIPPSRKIFVGGLPVCLCHLASPLNELRACCDVVGRQARVLYFTRVAHALMASLGGTLDLENFTSSFPAFCALIVADNARNGTLPALHGLRLQIGLLGRGLAYVRVQSEVTSEALSETFAAFGELSEAKVIVDREGVSKRFGFVTFKDLSAAEKALLVDHTFQGKVVDAKRTPEDEMAARSGFGGAAPRRGMAFTAQGSGAMGMGGRPGGGFGGARGGRGSRGSSGSMRGRGGMNRYGMGRGGVAYDDGYGGFSDGSGYGGGYGGYGGSMPGGGYGGHSGYGDWDGYEAAGGGGGGGGRGWGYDVPGGRLGGESGYGDPGYPGGYGDVEYEPPVRRMGPSSRPHSASYTDRATGGYGGYDGGWGDGYGHPANGYSGYGDAGDPYAGAYDGEMHGGYGGTGGYGGAPETYATRGYGGGEAAATRGYGGYGSGGAEPAWRRSGGRPMSGRARTGMGAMGPAATRYHPY